MAEQAKQMPEKSKHAGGHPRLHFDLRQLEDLGKIQSTQAELAAVLGCGLSTLKDRLANDGEFSAAYERGLEAGKSSLRRIQWKSALAGNITMQIWLGKQYLGQTDRYAGELTGKGGAPVELGFDSILRKLVPELVDGSAPAAPQHALDSGR